ncbi:uncharacterized protein GGS22DRAFT_162370 [Annulohypoxylon maeteangense]|uniref:uncharacterized protein n=1 Tax=Annulohypoxylon maeteangense TaxID=1927788 RepID=UPI002007F9C6|nr:uncharacterized protein GGS22DRAFT_162370 [Annulohypoxylon maeteangense]KAI0884953.1 hypothetical protein GGS22DRAFT_162370 [Annulohypoxylon maeteangense]
MESLPVELLIQIFSSFCFHCRCPGDFPNADLDYVRSDKKVLAHLCRTSKFICSVAQPILYHFYATGNSRIRIIQADGYVGFPNEPDFLAQFVRTIAQRPDLASQITTMHIVRTNSLMGYETQMQTVKSLIDFSISKNLLKKPCLPDNWLDGHFSRWRIGYQEDLHRWLATLAAVLCPRLKSLFLNIDTNAHFPALEESPHIKLLSLQTLGVMSFVIDYHISELHALYAAAPNLETLYACDSSGWISKMLFDTDYKLHLSNVKRLAISDSTSNDLENLVRCTPKLEDLEYYWEDMDEEKEYHFRDMAEVLKPAKDTLKRLGVTFLPRAVHLDPFPKWIEPPVVDYPPIKTLREFTVLENLSIDCFLLYREQDVDTDDRLVDLLPQSIRSLRISYVYRGILYCLRQLAIDAPKKFPFLKEVILGISERTDPRYDYKIELSIALEKEFEASGIKFELQDDALGAHARTIIPGDVVGSNMAPVPRILNERGY